MKHEKLEAKSELVLPITSNFFVITGQTTITAMRSVAPINGQIVHLQFPAGGKIQNTPVPKKEITCRIRLKDKKDFDAITNDIISLVHNSGCWLEYARSEGDRDVFSVLFSYLKFDK